MLIKHLSINVFTSDSNNSVVRELAQYTRGPVFESNLRLGFSPPVRSICSFILKRSEKCLNIVQISSKIEMGLGAKSFYLQ